MRGGTAASVATLGDVYCRVGLSCSAGAKLDDSSYEAEVGNDNDSSSSGEAL